MFIKLDVSEGQTARIHHVNLSRVTYITILGPAAGNKEWVHFHFAGPDANALPLSLTGPQIKSVLGAIEEMDGAAK